MVWGWVVSRGMVVHKLSDRIVTRQGALEEIFKVLKDASLRFPLARDWKSGLTELSLLKQTQEQILIRV
jgi:hypothetical protein